MERTGKEMTEFTICGSPIGELTLTSDGEALTGVFMETRRHSPEIMPDWGRRDDAAILRAAREQLAAYFAGRLRDFDIPLRMTGTPFQKTVWNELKNIPYGMTINYGELAQRIGNPKASRAVGLANGRNPVSIIVPCHRVIGANGSLTGYGGGIERKRSLLALEAGFRSLTATAQ
jgi:methylated-DNA-[protein]-cysteine S-methyltransferase